MTLAQAGLASSNDAATGSFCTRLLGELDCRGEETPKPRTGGAYIGLGEACLTPGLVMHLLPHLHVSHPIGCTLSTSQNLIIIPHLHVSHLIGYTLSTLQNLIIWARQCLCKKLYCICTHWLFVQTYAWWPAVVSATLQRHMWLPTG